MEKNTMTEWSWTVEFPACPCPNPCDDMMRKGKGADVVTQADYEPWERSIIWSWAEDRAYLLEVDESYALLDVLIEFHWHRGNWCPEAKVTLWHRGKKFDVGTL